MISYFDHVLEKITANKTKRETTLSNLRLKDESIILYGNYVKISTLHIYASFFPTAMVEN